MVEVMELSRIEKIIDALERRGLSSSNFSNLCSELQILMDELSSKLAVAPMEDENIKKRASLIINRLNKLETFANAQSEITSGLQKYIANPDK